MRDGFHTFPGDRETDVLALTGTSTDVRVFSIVVLPAFPVFVFSGEPRSPLTLTDAFEETDKTEDTTTVHIRILLFFI